MMRRMEEPTDSHLTEKTPPKRGADTVLLFLIISLTALVLLASFLLVTFDIPSKAALNPDESIPSAF